MWWSEILIKYALLLQAGHIKDPLNPRDVAATDNGEISLDSISNLLLQ